MDTPTEGFSFGGGQFYERKIKLKDGWIKLHRKIRDNEIWEEKPFDKARAWIDLLLRASHRGHIIEIKGEEIKLKPGQLFITKKGLAESWGWSRTKVANFLNVLAGKNKNEDNKMINISNHFRNTFEPLSKKRTPKKTPIGMVITIINWELYQSGAEEKSTKESTKKSTKKTLKRHIQECIKNDKECKEINNNICPEKYKFSGQDKILASYLKYLIKNNKPDYKFSNNCVERWANEVRLMRERDKRDHDRIKKVMEFALNDDFWKYNILSMEKLRKQFDRLEMQMNKGKKKSFIDMELERIRKEKEVKK